ncbi:hypothetical protein ABZS29_13835 [Kribbella sp. NPDC005582]|uniref:hypothetical protein n=1 Tax=Kribbella sp. NPDC005582 TaxID=3156893 RepID=UPI0033A527F1
MTQAGWRFVAPDDFDDVDWADVTDRGVLTGRLVHGDREFPVVVYDPVRIGQDAERGTEGDVVLYEPNVIMVEHLTRESAENAVAHLAKAGSFDWMLG